MAGGSGKSLGKIVLTHRSLEALKPGADAYRVPDLRCPGLAIRVAPSGLKTWDFVCRIRGASTVKRKALGAFPGVSLDDARRRARAIGDAAQVGKDLIGEEAKAKEAAAARMTVLELIDEYIKRRARGLRTQREIETRLKRALAPINSRPIDELRRRDIGRLGARSLVVEVDREGKRARQRRLTRLWPAYPAYRKETRMAKSNAEAKLEAATAQHEAAKRSLQNLQEREGAASEMPESYAEWREQVAKVSAEVARLEVLIARVESEREAEQRRIRPPHFWEVLYVQ